MDYFGRKLLQLAIEFTKKYTVIQSYAVLNFDRKRHRQLLPVGRKSRLCVDIESFSTRVFLDNRSTHFGTIIADGSPI